MLQQHPINQPQMIHCKIYWAQWALALMFYKMMTAKDHRQVSSYTQYITHVFFFSQMGVMFTRLCACSTFRWFSRGYTNKSFHIFNWILSEIFQCRCKYRLRTYYVCNCSTKSTRSICQTGYCLQSRFVRPILDCCDIGKILCKLQQLFWSRIRTTTDCVCNFRFFR